jgi:hypothetical protein
MPREPVDVRQVRTDRPHHCRFIDAVGMNFEYQVLNAVEYGVVVCEHGFLGPFNVDL